MGKYGSEIIVDQETNKHCQEHSGIEAKLENIEKAFVQVMDELKTRKLTPGAAWVIGTMASALGAMAMWIINHNA